jgi:hypothetical protein
VKFWKKFDIPGKEHWRDSLTKKLVSYGFRYGAFSDRPYDVKVYLYGILLNRTTSQLDGPCSSGPFGTGSPFIVELIRYWTEGLQYNKSLSNLALGNISMADIRYRRQKKIRYLMSRPPMPAPYLIEALVLFIDHLLLSFLHHRHFENFINIYRYCLTKLGQKITVCGYRKGYKSSWDTIL